MTLLVERSATPDEVAAISQVLAERGIEASVRAGYEQKSLDQGPWAINLLEIALTAFVAAFARDLYTGGKVAAARAVRAFLSRLATSRSSARRGADAIWLQDPHRHIDIVLSADAPDAALVGLFEIDLDRLDDGDTIRYDLAEGDWWIRISRGMGKPEPAPRKKVD